MNNKIVFSPTDAIAVSCLHQVVHVHDGVNQGLEVAIAEELAVAISYDGTTHAVMMATPDCLAELAVGFSLTENIISHIDEIEEINIVRFDHGIDVQLRLVPLMRDAFIKRRRHMAGPVGCGLCGIESLEAAMRNVPCFDGNITLTPKEVCESVELLSKQQKLNQITRCSHAAAFYISGQGLVGVCEDIGRHNGVDKLIGTLLLNNIDMKLGALVVTSRLSMEIIQKAAMAGIGMVIGISAPTAQALRFAQTAGLTVIARARGQNFDIHCNAQRII